MTDQKSEEIQSELFQEFSSFVKKPERLPLLHKAQKPLLFSTSVEQVIFFGILLILAFCLVFFLGVLRGKSLTASGGAPIHAQQPPAQVSRMLAMPQYRPPAQKTTATVSDVVSAQPSNKPYMIQVVTHKRADLAERDMLTFRRSGYQSVIVPSGDYYQVCVGEYATKDEAKKDLKFFGLKYKDCFLRRR